MHLNKVTGVHHWELMQPISLSEYDIWQPAFPGIFAEVASALRYPNGFKGLPEGTENSSIIKKLDIART